MVMEGKKGYSLKCESCGNEDAVFFDETRDAIKLLAFKMRPVKKCPKCSGKMKVDSSKQIVF